MIRMSHFIVQNHRNFYILLVQNSNRTFNLSLKIHKSIESLDDLEISHYIDTKSSQYWMNNCDFMVSYESEIINNGVFFTDSNGLALTPFQFMAKDTEFNSDTTSLASNLKPVTAITLIKDELNWVEMGVVIDRPSYATSEHEG